MNYNSDIETILSHRNDNGADFWATPDKRLLKGAPFTTLESPLYLLELGLSPTDSIMKETANLIFSVWKEDGRFKIYPNGGIYPCQTAEAARTLCHMGYGSDKRLETTFRYFLDSQYSDGGWRCNKFFFGRGPETEYSNPYPTLIALDAFRYSNYLNAEPALDKAVDFLLEHWTIRKPIGLAITELVHYLCRLNTLSVITTFFNMFMFYPFMNVLKAIKDFLKH